MTVIRIMLQDIRRNAPFLIACILVPCVMIGTAVIFAFLGLDADLGALAGLAIVSIGTGLYRWAASARRRLRERDREWTA